MNLDFLRNHLPIHEWRVEMEEQLNDEEVRPGEVKFSEEILLASELILNEFIGRLESPEASSFTEDLVKQEVKKLVLAINELDKNKHFIDTGQREDLVSFVDMAIEAIQFKKDGETDYTLEWREW